MNAPGAADARGAAAAPDEGAAADAADAPSAPSPAGLLARRREQLLREAGAAESRLSDIRSTRSSGSDDDEHDPEGETLSAQWSQAEGLRAGLAEELAEVDRALARVADGSYGTCARCGRSIGSARLEARPTAELCIDCARAAEARR